MTTPNPEKPDQQVCIMQIAFPVDSDDQAISIKKKIGEILSLLPDSSIDFRLVAGNANQRRVSSPIR